MKLQPDLAPGINLIQHLGSTGLRVQNRLWSHSVLIPAQGEIVPWPVAAPQELSVEHFTAVCDLECELVIFGSGQRLRFPPPALLQPLMQRRIGLETMDTAAACRTFNILAAEGRKVLAAIIWPGLSTP